MWNRLKARTTGALAGTLLVVLFLVILAQIILRVVGQPLVWAEEFSLIGFIWLIFAGVAVAYQRREHLEVDLLYRALAGRLNARGRTVWDVFVGLASLLFLTVLGIGLVLMTRQTWTTSLGSLPGFRYGWIYLGVLLAVLTCIGIVVAQLLPLRHGPRDPGERA